MYILAIAWGLFAAYVAAMASILPGVTEVVMVSSLWLLVCLKLTFTVLLHTWTSRPQTQHQPQPQAGLPANQNQPPV